MACASLIRPCSRVLVAGGTGIVGSGVVQELLKQGVKVIVGTRNMDNFNALYEQTPANLRCSLYASVGDVNTEEGAKSVFDQATKDCAGVQHVVAALRGGKTSWECGRLWDQSLSQFFDGSREEVAGHFLLMKLFLPYLEFVAGSTYTMVTGYPGNACPAPGTPSTLLSLAFGTLGGLAESARIEQRRSKVAVSELHLRCIVLRELDNDIIGLGSQHLGHDLIGSVVTAVAGCGARRQVVIKGREDALMWTKTESPSVQPKFPFIPPSSRPGCGPCR